jgi:hypothetical protein
MRSQVGRLSAISSNFERRSSRHVGSGWERSGRQPSPRDRRNRREEDTRAEGRDDAGDVGEPAPAEIQAAFGELVGVAREGLLALSVGVGLGVVHELMEAEVDEVVGPKGEHNPDRVKVTATRMDR